MPRPKKWRRVCQLPQFSRYGPVKRNGADGEVVEMTVEEYEAMRLIDHEGFDQEEAAKNMGIARSTVQRIYNDVRGKIADSLVNGKILFIRGGNYRLCEFGDGRCPYCRQRRREE